jgi:hypothetical protein
LLMVFQSWRRKIMISHRCKTSLASQAFAVAHYRSRVT